MGFMHKMWKNLLNIFWPCKCVNCGKYGNYLCQNCFSLVEINFSPHCPIKELYFLDGLYFGTPYENKIVKELIRIFKYNYVKELSLPLSSFIISHFKVINKQAKDFSDFILCPVPLHKSKLKKRGFNQSEEIANHLSAYLNIPIKNFLIKTKNTLPQTALDRLKRKANVYSAFSVNPLLEKDINNSNILLVDDVFTTGATIDECARILKQKGAQRVLGAVIARG